MGEPTEMVTKGNLLGNETSPYLLQHADNPVHWRPWGEAALAEAKELNKPILLSVGYAACHWCHVMAHESFEDEDTAALMNALFVNIKVDREERPDIDQIYMAALHALGQQGGWPLTMFLTPDAKPFYGGTYYPKEALYGRPSFKLVLESIAHIHSNEPSKIEQNQTALMAHLRELNGSTVQKTALEETTALLSLNLIDQASKQLLGMSDPDHGGLRGAPKFPNCQTLKLIYLRGLRHNNSEAFQAVDLALTKMSQGGLYDHLGGGYARYCVDAVWLVPHFEKMLYDNAQLIDLLSLSVARTHNPLHLQRLEETIAWLERDMASPSGGFFASIDADSEGEEGKFYIWSETEVDAVLGDLSPVFKEHYDVSRGGNWEGHSILNRLNQSTLAAPDTEAQLAKARTLLLKHRQKRIPPGIDDKILADWNGLTLAAIAHAGARLNRSTWIKIAEESFNALMDKMQAPDGELAHAEREGRQTRPGFASDYAMMASAALALFQATDSSAYLTTAVALMTTLDTGYSSEDGGLFMSVEDAADVVVRPRAEADEAIPSAAGVAADVWVRLWILTGDDVYKDRVDRLFAAVAPKILKNAFTSASLLSALDLRLLPLQAFILDVGSAEETHALTTAIHALGHPNVILLTVSRETSLPHLHPAKAKIETLPLDAPATLFLCVGSTCSLPITDPDQAESRFRALLGSPVTL